MRSFLCRVSPLRSALTAALLLVLSSTALAATHTPPVVTADQFVQGVAALETTPLDVNAQHNVPALLVWLNANHPLPASVSLCTAQMLLVSDAQTGDELASKLYTQNQLELVSYQLQHPQASASEAQSAALTGTLRAYLAMQKGGMKENNAFADSVLADIKARGLASLPTHTCAGGGVAPVANATASLR
jgi:hypothetical protein